MNMENMIFCQSCGMPMTSAEHFGTNADESRNCDYCAFCYAGGEFTQDCTMDGMIEHCVQFLEEFNKDSDQQFTREQAIAQMQQYFPKLKRWAK